MVKLIALYKKPDDVASFDKHYAEIHAPLVKKLPGLRHMELAKITGSAIGETPEYLLCEMYFDTRDALDAALASPAGRAAGKDLMGFAAKYVTLMYADVTSRENIKTFED
ncbi:MAG TPA: EthD family reductase [Bacteroidota bacterium]|nr:EthD family reductase [Bacteroidota bacterium]